MRSRLATLLAAVLALGGCHRADSASARGTRPDSAMLARDIAYLADDRLEGRGTGTPGNDSAAVYIARRFAALGLEPLPGVGTPCPPTDGVPECPAAYLQPFTAQTFSTPRTRAQSMKPAQNVVAVLPGADPLLRGQYVVLGAHYDHLGRSPESALDPEAGDAIRNGADDNASGTAAVLELARLLRQRPPRRTVIFVAFSGEELGLLGSMHFVSRAPVPLDSVQAMLNFDMVGRLRNDRLLVYGVGTAAELPGIVESANAGPRLAVSTIPDGFGPSDHSAFHSRGLPVLHFFTDLHDDYHRASDDAATVNVGGLARVLELAVRVTRALADRPERLTSARATAPPALSTGSGSDVYLGTVPDMSAADVAGVRLSAVRPGSPADSAGLRADDVIVEFDGARVANLHDYSAALYARRPGDTVAVVVLRAEKRVTLRATLGRRSR